MTHVIGKWVKSSSSLKMLALKEAAHVSHDIEAVMTDNSTASRKLSPQEPSLVP
jgi:hypothetical protein